MSKLIVLLISFPLAVYAQDKSVRIVALGDSLTAGYGLEKEDAYPALLEKALKQKGKNVQVVNAGVSGATTAGADGRLKWQLRSSVDILILALGANDGLRGLDLGNSRKNLEAVLDLAKEKNLKVILAGMLLPTNYGPDYRGRFEGMFSELAKKYGVVFVPFLLKDVATVKELNLADGIHPNEKGHMKMMQNLLPYVEKLL